MNISFNKNYPDKKIVVICRYNAPLDTVWDAFTNPVIMEKWFAPKPYKAITKISDFREGEYWLYYMLSPEGEKFWSIIKYTNIQTNKLYEASDAFCDENGVINTSLPQLNWRHDFSETNGETTVYIDITFASEPDMKKILEMGFEEGYRMSLNQLQEVLRG